MKNHTPLVLAELEAEHSLLANTIEKACNVLTRCLQPDGISRAEAIGELHDLLDLPSVRAVVAAAAGKPTVGLHPADVSAGAPHDVPLYLGYNENAASGKITAVYALQVASPDAIRALHVQPMVPHAAADELRQVYDLFSIGSEVRQIGTLRTNIENVIRRSQCLRSIERTFFTKEVPVEDWLAEEPGGTVEECPLLWGASPASYVEQFREALDAIRAEEAKAGRTQGLQEAVDECEQAHEDGANAWACMMAVRALQSQEPAPRGGPENARWLPSFPPRDPALPSEQQGMFHKFEVRRVDGTDKIGGKHHGCRYFVLDLDHDAHAPAAMAAYGQSCLTTHPQLGAEINEEFGWASALGATK